MVWSQLDVNRPHLVYIILGGFTSLFMLCSSVIKERLYIGEATVATICGIIFGPHAAGLIVPGHWGNTDQITLEFSRIVLVVQCFAVGVELPKAYMERHWRSVVFLLVPVMTFGWLVTSLFIWAVMYEHLSWLDSLCIAACVTATDPVLASSVVGKGKFAKRVPKHLRDLLSAESGCNDGMAFPFIYLALYLIRYRPDANAVSFHWFCITILYECIFGATYGVIVGYLARRAIRYAHERDLIDRESFLVFYFVLALFCAGSGSILGIDDLLVGFSCGVGFSNDGWFLEKTEEAHVSNVIDLLINLAFFVYFGTIVPWQLFNAPVIGTSPWRLVVIALLVVFFRRIPIMLALKPLIPDIKTWREALFAGHFGPIGVGAIFVAILARAELETDSTTPLEVLPDPNFPHDNIIELIWPITTFLVITSIIVHGSSIAVFTLGKHINTLTISLSYTQGNEDRYSWMERLPRIQSRSKSSMSKDDPDALWDDKDPEAGNYAETLPRNFLRRQKESDTPRTLGKRHTSRRRRWDAGLGPGGPISQSAISPIHAQESEGIASPERTDSDTLAAQESPDSSSRKHEQGSDEEADARVYEEGDENVIEDAEGNVLKVTESHGESREDRQRGQAEDVKELVEEGKLDKKESMREREIEEEEEGQENEVARPAKGRSESSDGKETGLKGMRRKLSNWGNAMNKAPEQPSKAPVRKSGPARAFRFGRTIIIEDEDGEVIQKYDIPAPQKETKAKKETAAESSTAVEDKSRLRLQRMGTWLGFSQDMTQGESADGQGRRGSDVAPDEDDGVRFTVGGDQRRMSKLEFIKQVQALDPRFRGEMIEESNAPAMVKEQLREEPEKSKSVAQAAVEDGEMNEARMPTVDEDDDVVPELHRTDTAVETGGGREGLYPVDSHNAAIPVHSVSSDLRRVSLGGETAAQRRRRQLPEQRPGGGSRTDRRGSNSTTLPHTVAPQPNRPRSDSRRSNLDEEETAAERRRREAALGVSKEESESESESESVRGTGREEEKEKEKEQPRLRTSFGVSAPSSSRIEAVPEPESPRYGIRFMEQPRPGGAGGSSHEGGGSRRSRFGRRS